MTQSLTTKVLIIGAGTGGYDAPVSVQRIKGLLEHPTLGIG
jgi:pyruvate/2-oxoglutarate dehydrogenase complex dihydrolipoamide dehydrogenase (E3) component